jgi:hypothetical protein
MISYEQSYCFVACFPDLVIFKKPYSDSFKMGLSSDLCFGCFGGAAHEFQIRGLKPTHRLLGEQS